MCGIAGFTWVDNQLIKKMLKTLRHRGPDDEGVYSDENVTLGHRRLSILDLSLRGHQPMQSEDGNILIVHNGEIYNYKELRSELEKLGYRFRSNTDTEVIIYAYKEWGVDCLRKFNGMWAFVIYDKTKNILFLSRDRFGIKPIYYFINEDKNLIFASEIKAILHIKDQWSPNDQAIFDFLMYDVSDHKDFTFFEGIMKIPKAHYGIYDISEKKLEIKRYWSLNVNERSIPEEDMIKDIEKLFVNSVKLRLRSDVPVGSCLSGGVDSSSIVAVMSKIIDDKNKLNTFSAVYPGFEKNEEEYIDILTEKLNINNSKIIPTTFSLLEDLNRFVYHMDEPMKFTSQYTQYCVMKLASQHRYKVLLDGQGADEMLAGYNYFYGYYLYELFTKMKLKSFVKIILFCFNKIPNKVWIKTFLFLLSPKFLKIKLLKREQPYLNKKFIKKNMPKSDVFEKVFNVKTLKESLIAHIEYKLEQLLKWEDRNSMAFSIETRVPFLDYRLVEYLMNIPSEYILNKCLTKYIFRKTMEKYVPKQVIYREDKVGFEAPRATWLRSSQIRKFFEEILESETFRNRKYWNAKKIKKMWEEHQKGIKDHSINLWKILSVELWLRTFIDSRGGVGN